MENSENVYVNNEEKGLILGRNGEEIKAYSSIDLEVADIETKKKVYKVMNEKCDILLKDMKGKELEITDVIMTPYKIQAKVDEKTGEIIEDGKLKFRTVIIDKTGKTYISTAYGVYNSLKKIIAVFGNPKDWEGMKVKVVEEKLDSTHTTLKLEIVE